MTNNQCDVDYGIITCFIRFEAKQLCIFQIFVKYVFISYSFMTFLQFVCCLMKYS